MASLKNLRDLGYHFQFFWNCLWWVIYLPNLKWIAQVLLEKTKEGSFTLLRNRIKSLADFTSILKEIARWGSFRQATSTPFAWLHLSNYESLLYNTYSFSLGNSLLIIRGYLYLHTFWVLLQNNRYTYIAVNCSLYPPYLVCDDIGLENALL